MVFFFFEIYLFLIIQIYFYMLKIFNIIKNKIFIN